MYVKLNIYKNHIPVPLSTSDIILFITYPSCFCSIEQPYFDVSTFAL